MPLRDDTAKTLRANEHQLRPSARHGHAAQNIEE
jgi:hypothetical protein